MGASNQHWIFVEPITYCPDHPPKPGYVLCTFLKFTETTRSEFDTVSYLGWFPPRRPRVRGNANSLTRDFFERLEEMKRINQEKQAKAGKWVQTDDGFVKDRPQLDAYMTDGFWDDGKPRDVCSLTIRLSKAGAMVSLNDPENEQSITTNAQSVEAALEALEAYLATGNPSWRAWGKKKR